MAKTVFYGIHLRPVVLAGSGCDAGALIQVYVHGHWRCGRVIGEKRVTLAQADVLTARLGDKCQRCGINYWEVSV